jgi:hypothetical protein
MSKKFDDFGRVVMENGKVVEENIAIFDFLRDIFANLTIVLQPVLDNLVLIFDPFERLGLTLEKIREVTMQFQLSFERYLSRFKNFAKSLQGEERRMFEATIPFRAALQAINNALLAMGAYGRKDFDEIAQQIGDPTKKIEDFGGVIRRIIDSFLGSDAAKKVGFAIGNVIGVVVSQVGDMMKAAAGLATGGKLAQGFGEGFRAAGGPQGIADIIRSVFHLFGKLLIEVIKAAPLEVAIATALVALGPAIAGAIGTKIVEGALSGVGGGGGTRGGGMRGGGRFGAGGSISRLNRMRRGGMARSAGRMIEPWMNYAATSDLGQKAGRMARGAGRASRMVPGGALAAGAVDLGIALATGENFGKAAVGAIGTVLGATAGSVFGPAGTVIGGMAGGALADLVYSQFDPAARQQREAAQLQLEAANRQKAVSDLQRITKATGVSDAAFQYGNVKELQARLNYLGYGSDKAAQALVEEYKERNVAAEALKSSYLQLEQFKATLSATQTPSEKQKRRLTELNNAINRAKGVYEREQRELANKFGQTPQKITDALINNINAKMSMTRIEEAIAARIRGEAFLRRQERRGPSPGGIDPNSTNKPPGGRGLAFGGPVSANKMYMVGERGPEMFVSNTAGRIIPNDAMGGTSVNVGTINVSGGNAREVADQIASELLTAMYRKSRSEVLTS